MGPGCPNEERKPHQFPICENSKLAREDHLGRDRNTLPLHRAGYLYPLKIESYFR
jgi:hypothetical protein